MDTVVSVRKTGARRRIGSGSVSFGHAIGGFLRGLLLPT